MDNTTRGHSGAAFPLERRFYSLRKYAFVCRQFVNWSGTGRFADTSSGCFTLGSYG